MHFTAEVVSYIPYLRRYARALTGSTEVGDDLVAATIERLSPGSTESQPQDAKLELYRQFSVIWRSIPDDSKADDLGGRPRSVDDDNEPRSEDTPAKDAKLRAISSLPRQAFLLVALEQFEAAQAARILDVSPDEFERLQRAARDEIAAQVSTDVLIIEDELFIALELQRLIEGLGHRVSAIARTREAAAAAARAEPPGLILADIQLADFSSGVDAVADMLKTIAVPAIFVTAYPERVLTGAKVEPTFVIAKPFDSDNVRAAVSQALLFGDTASLKGA